MDGQEEGPGKARYSDGAGWYKVLVELQGSVKTISVDFEAYILPWVGHT